MIGRDEKEEESTGENVFFPVGNSFSFPMGACHHFHQGIGKFYACDPKSENSRENK